MGGLSSCSGIWMWVEIDKDCSTIDKREYAKEGSLQWMKSLMSKKPEIAC